MRLAQKVKDREGCSELSIKNPQNDSMRQARGILRERMRPCLSVPASLQRRGRQWYVHANGTRTSMLNRAGCLTLHPSVVSIEALLARSRSTAKSARWDGVGRNSTGVIADSREAAINVFGVAANSGEYSKGVDKLCVVSGSRLAGGARLHVYQPRTGGFRLPAVLPTAPGRLLSETYVFSEPIASRPAGRDA